MPFLSSNFSQINMAASTYPSSPCAEVGRLELGLLQVGVRDSGSHGAVLWTVFNAEPLWKKGLCGYFRDREACGACFQVFPERAHWVVLVTRAERGGTLRSESL